MKPIGLSICAFGAFAGSVEVDFEALAPHGLFLVSGETGTGKTTIFDAMCWALYGKMPCKQSYEVRSDHVDEATRCEVVFTFESGGERYTVTRNPDQKRPSKKNSARQVNETAAASLVRIVDGDTATELVADKVSEVAHACERIIGLDADQFQRVILLPQGDFSKFLQASSSEREEILERLFGGEVYDWIVDELKATRDATAGAVADVESAIATALGLAENHVDHADDTLAEADAESYEADEDETGDDEVGAHRDLADDTESVSGDDGTGASTPDDRGDQDELALREHLEAAVVRLDAELARRRSDLTAASEARSAAQAAHDQAVTGANAFDDAVALRARITELEAAAGAVEAARLAAVTSQQVRPIVDAADALAHAVTEHGAAADERDARRNRIVGVLDGLGGTGNALTPVALQKHAADLMAAHHADATKLQNLLATQEALEAARKSLAHHTEAAEEAKTAQAEAVARSESIDEELPGLREEAVDPEAIVEAIAVARQAAKDRAALANLEIDLAPLSTSRVEAASAHQRLLEGFTDTQAPRLAATLTGGDPCPVCGSTNHPAPATADGAPVIAWDDVVAASDQHTRLDDEVRTLEDQITALRAKLGDAAELDIALLQSRVDDKQAELDGAKSVAARVATLEAERVELTTDLQRLTAEVAKLGEARDEADRKVAEAEKAAAGAADVAEGVDSAELEHRAVRLAELGGLLEGYDALVAAETTAASLMKSRQADLTTLLEASDHDDMGIVRSLLLPADQERAALDAATEHRSSLDGALGELKTLVDQGIPDERPDPALTEVTLRRADADRKRIESLVTTLEFDVDGAATALQEADRRDAESADLRTRADVARRAHQVCAHGGPALPVPLKRWVLAHELDRITASANVHLAAMTNARYGLRRRTNQQDGRRSFGLDIEVDDTNTGRARSTSSLSGGEQFQASLALALGLADVISQGGTSSGQHFEALFVDEGFGSLSADALDDAVATLYGLHETGRMVGAITHVEAMKLSLPVGIEVVRRDDGRGSTLTVRS